MRWLLLPFYIWACLHALPLVERWLSPFQFTVFGGPQ